MRLKIRRQISGLNGYSDGEAARNGNEGIRADLNIVLTG